MSDNNIAYKILEEAFRLGYKVEIDDGDGERVVQTDMAMAKETVEFVDECSVYIHYGENQEDWMFVIPTTDDDGWASDFSTGGFVEKEWEKHLGS